MVKRNTKQVIMDEALQLFAIHGYQGVSVRDIAKAVGIKESSLYKHYSNKQDIFDHIVHEMNERYNQTQNQVGIPSDEAAMLKQFEHIEEDVLIQMGVQLFLFFIHDDYNRKYRAMLTIEQYKNEAARAQLIEQYMEAPIQYQAHIFAYLCEHGTLQGSDPLIMAYHFYTPIYLELHRCDIDEQHVDASVAIITRHIRQFCEIYQTHNK